MNPRVRPEDPGAGVSAGAPGEIARQGASSAIVVVLPLPPKEVHPNARTHYMARARAAREYRARAGIMARLAVREAGVFAPCWTEATCEARFYVKDRRRRDRDNLLASLKAAFDGIADAEVVDDDAGLTHLPVVVEVDRSRPRVELHLSPVDR